MDERRIIELLSDLKHRIFPRPFERLAVSGRNLVGAEIGVFEGEHAVSLLEHLDIQCLYLIDPYEMYDGYYDEGYKQYGTAEGLVSRTRTLAVGRLASYGDRVKWLFCRSVEGLRQVPCQLDFVYIDGNHSLEFVRQDICGAVGKVRAGGIVGGHDFYNGFCRSHDGVVRAVIEAVVANKWNLRVELPDWWFVKE